VRLVVFLSTLAVLCTALPAQPVMAAGSDASAILGLKPALAKPLWSELTPAQKVALTPLQAEWDALPEVRKKKWLEIAGRYATLKPEEQARLQERMRDWLKLTPEQRMAARENFAKTKQIAPEKKSEQWQKYQQLSEEEKKKLAADQPAKKSLTNLSPDALRNPNTLQPIKGNLPKPAAPAAVAKPVTASAPAVSTPVQAPASVVAPAAASVPAEVPATVPASVTSATK